MKKEELLWDDFEEIEVRNREIRFEFEMDFGTDSDGDFYSGSDIEYDS